MRLGALVRLRPAERRLLIEATAQLARASLALRFGPSGRTVKALGRPTEAVAASVAGDRQSQALAVGQMVTRSAHRLPWHPTCLRQAMATQRMLRRRGIPCQVHLGITDPRALSAHAWVTVGERIVVGARGSGAATPLAAFT